MDSAYQVYLPIIVCLGFVLTVLLFWVLYQWAKKQKGAALAVGLFIQMFLPDPKVEQTIEWVSEKKEKAGESQKDNESEH